jgi:hypothetical protein
MRASISASVSRGITKAKPSFAVIQLSLKQATLIPKFEPRLFRDSSLGRAKAMAGSGPAMLECLSFRRRREDLRCHGASGVAAQHVA